MEDKEFGRRGAEMLRHRGPDGNGEWCDAGKGLYLGHTRLAIIDRSDGASQPMVRKNHVIAYNGELYNYLEVRKELIILGWEFQTSSDTEVLLVAWMEWGKFALDRFDGMYAFVIYDGDCVHLVSDPFGEKPLYWSRLSSGIYFSSEAGVLTELLNLGFEPTGEQVTFFLGMGFFPAPETGFPSLSIVRPSTHLTINQRFQVDESRYWSIPQVTVKRGIIHKPDENDLDRILEVLIESLRRRLRSDVPVGLFLSSGVDSTLLAALIAKELNVDISAFTVSFADGVDESDAAKRVACHFGIRHQVINSLQDLSWQHIPAELRSLYGVPNDNPTVIAVRQMSELIKPSVSVALSGLGGDELFYGYSKYFFLYQHRFAYRYLARLFSRIKGMKFGAFHKLRLAQELFCGDKAWQFISLKNYGLGLMLRSLHHLPDSYIKDFSSDKRDLVYLARDFDLTQTLPGSYISAVERGSMRASVEVRTPFLSRELLAETSKLDQRAFMQYGQKYVLRQLLYRYIPQDLLSKSKQGFVYPTKRYLSIAPKSCDVIRGLPHALCQEIWQNRLNDRYTGLAVRLCVLEDFLSKG